MTGVMQHRVAPQRKRPTMTGPRRSAGSMDVLRETSRHQELLRVAVLLGAATGLLATWAAGELSIVGVVVVAVGAGVAAIRPDSHAAAVAVIGICWQWFAGVDDSRTPWAMVAAAAVLVVHTSTALATVAPPSAALPPAMPRRWMDRAAFVLAGTVVVWGVAFVLAELNTGANVVIAAAGSVAVLGVVWLLWPQST